MEIKTFTKSVIILPAGDAIYSERATTVSITDEAAGPFVVVEQEEDTIRLDSEEWPTIRAAIDAQFEVCQQLDASMKEASHADEE